MFVTSMGTYVTSVCTLYIGGRLPPRASVYLVADVYIRRWTKKQYNQVRNFFTMDTYILLAFTPVALFTRQ
jgi:hypothetical protein